MSRQEILCQHCGNHCGWLYPANLSSENSAPPFAEGLGEDYIDEYGNWYCSQPCLDKHAARGEE